MSHVNASVVPSAVAVLMVLTTAKGSRSRIQIARRLPRYYEAVVPA
jgi:hypothetical protein